MMMSMRAPSSDRAFVHRVSNGSVSGEQTFAALSRELRGTWLASGCASAGLDTAPMHVVESIDWIE
jgi:hypothetical protein